MAGIACNGSRQVIMQQSLNFVAPQNLTLRLFKNNITPTDTDNVNASGYTEATFTGYSAAALTAASWSVTSAHPAVATYPAVTFTSTANQTLENEYGYYITRADGTLYVAERFTSAPFGISLNGQTIQITPTVSLTD